MSLKGNGEKGKERGKRGHGSVNRRKWREKGSFRKWWRKRRGRRKQRWRLKINWRKGRRNWVTLIESESEF